MRELRLVLLGLAAVLSILLGADFVLRAFRPVSQQIPTIVAPPNTIGA